MTTHLHTRRRRRSASKKELVSTPYTPTHDIRPPPCMRKHILSFLIPTRMRHVLNHVIEVVDWHFRADDVFSIANGPRGRLSLLVFSAHNEGKPGRQVCMMPGLSGESCGRRVFGRGAADATLVDGRLFFTHFSEPLTGTSCRVKIWKAASQTPARMAALWTNSVSRDPVIFFFFRRKQWRTMDAFVVTWNSKRFNLFGNEKTIKPQGLEPLQDGWWKCFIQNESTYILISGIRRERLNELCQSKKKLF